MSVTHESAFEANIEAHLLGDGWHKLDPAAYDRKAGVFGDEIIAFVQASQPKAWKQLVTRHGGRRRRGRSSSRSSWPHSTIAARSVCCGRR